MNAAYIHITLNTIPPVLNVTAVVILLVGMIRSSVPVTRTGLVLMLMAALVAVPTYLTGEGAEEIVKNIEGVNTTAIHPHEEAGEWALIVFIVQAVAVLVALMAGRKGTMPRWLMVLVAIVGLVATITVFRTAKLGGKIHHPETEMKRV